MAQVSTNQNIRFSQNFKNRIQLNLSEFTLLGLDVHGSDSLDNVIIATRARMITDKQLQNNNKTSHMWIWIFEVDCKTFIFRTETKEDNWTGNYRIFIDQNVMDYLQNEGLQPAQHTM